jgi:aryl-alcohol dehydrogenase-like predicted oxidoreductase
MEYTTLGKTGLVVSRVALGTMTFGTAADSSPGRGFSYTVDQEQANTLVSLALDAGINFFDTANIYALGRSEAFLGRALGSRRKEVIIATKLGFRMSPTLTDAGLSAHNVIAAAEASLKCLGTDYIDLLQLHTPDPLTPFEETARALDNLVQRGLVRYVGYSNFSGWQAATFLGLQHQHNYVPFVSAQMYYSLVVRDIEYEIVPFLQYAGLGLLVFSPLSGGFLTGKYTRENPTGDNGRLASFDVVPVDREMGYAVVEKLQAIAAAHGEATPAQVALAWLLTKPFVTSIILGASKPEQFSDNVKACNLHLSPEEVETLDALTTPSPLYPYRMPGLSDDPAVLHISVSHFPSAG